VSSEGKSAEDLAKAEEVLEGEGYAISGLDALGDGYGFRKVRRALGVTAFGVNAIVLPPGYETGRHYHDEQEELYFVHRGTVEFRFGDGSVHRLGPGGLARVSPTTVRAVRNVSDEDAVYLIAGGSGGYVGRDGRLPEGETSRFGSGPLPEASNPGPEEPAEAG
jgi:quercetin dioxygenase-like cupin family protein